MAIVLLLSAAPHPLQAYCTHSCPEVGILSICIQHFPWYR